MNPEAKIVKLSRGKMETILSNIAAALWYENDACDSLTWRWNVDKEHRSGADFIQTIALLMGDAGLAPDEPCFECGSELREVVVMTCKSCERDAGDGGAPPKEEDDQP